MWNLWPVIQLGCCCSWLVTTSPVSALALTEETFIDSVTPRYGSLNGETRLTIYGRGFAKSEFNFVDSSVGNRVQLVSKTRAVECTVHKDGTHATQIMFYTPNNMAEDTYYVRVTVDGARVPDDHHCPDNSDACSFVPHASYTPTVASIRPRASLPKSVVQVNGLLFTDKFVTAQATACDGRTTERILRVYFNNKLCELRVPGANDEYYGLGLDRHCRLSTLSNEMCLEGACDSQWGYFKCLTQSSYVGNQNSSYIVSGKYGRSRPDLETKNVMALGGIAMYQTFAEITGLSTSTVSNVGGLRLTISGRFFDETDEPAAVTVAGETCEVIEVSDEAIVCKMPAAPASLVSHAPGNRGVMMEIFNDTGISNPTIDDVTDFTDPTDVVYSDSLGYSYEPAVVGSYVGIRNRGYIVPPEDNDYRFYISSLYKAHLYLSTSTDPADKTLIAETTSYTPSFYENEAQHSERMSLSGGQPYYYELNYFHPRERIALDMAVHMYDTTYTSDMAGNVINEQQVIEAQAAIRKERVGVTLMNWGSRSSRSEVQTVSVSAVSGIAMFRLGMHGAFTEPMYVTSPASTVSSALNDLVTIRPHSTSVTSTAITGGMRHTITINDNGGNWPEFQVITAMTSSGEIPVTSSVSEMTPGISSMSHYQLDFGGHPSPAFSIDASEAEVTAAFNAMFSVRCPSIITSPSMRMKGNNFEDDDDVSVLSGTRVSDVEPFCGRYSLKSPKYLFFDAAKLAIDSARGKMCFAYHGHLQQRLDVRYEVIHENDRTTQHLETFEVELPVIDRWGYTCFDLYSMIADRHPTIMKTKITYISVVVDPSESEFYVDEIYIGMRMLVEADGFDELALYERFAPPQWIVQGVEVDGGARDFIATYTVADCSDDLPLLGIGHAPMDSGAANSATYRDTNWAGSANIAITRHQTASPPLGGTFDLSYDGQRLRDIPADVDEESLKAKLETLSGVGVVTVSRSGSCSGYRWQVDFVKGAAGDRPDLTVAADRVTGIDANLTVSTARDGGVFFHPIIGDMLMTYHEKPQARVKINGIPSQCTGNCSIEWTLDATPSVTAISPATGVSGDTLTITGTGFDPDNTTVVIGGVECDVTTASSTQLECSAGEGPTGIQDVVVYVTDKGNANHTSGSLQFTYQFSITDVSPSTGTTAGGTVLTLSGTGFGANVGVTIDGATCDVISYSYTTVRCKTPALSAGSYDVVGTDGTNTVTASDQFTSDASATPTVTSLNASSALVEGGSVIAISGSGFGSEAPNDNAVQFGGESAIISFWSDTEIVVSMPALGSGSYSIELLFPDGKADATAVSDVIYTLEVSSISPDYGSLYGGTLLTLSGAGFSTTPELNEVSIGSTGCEVIEASDDEIVCKTTDSATVHEIDNSGSHITFGRGYAWSKTTLTVAVGDSVQWTWNTPESVRDIAYKVEQTSNETANEYGGTGFNSGASSRSGVFTYKFTSAGTYFYWSGCVDPACSIKMRGTINVVAAESVAGQLQVMIGDFEAEYNMGSVSGKRRKKRATCTSATGAISGCSDSAPSGSATNHFHFAFWTCSTPYITDMQPLVGTSVTEITISGNGFGSSSCQNEVTVGGQSCVIRRSSDTSIECTVDPADVLQVGVPYEVSVVVNNRGMVLNTIDDAMARRFVLLPHVMTISPDSGSTAGGTRLTINGDGFSSDADGTSVSILGAACNIETLTYDRIICTTASAWAGNGVVVVTVFSNGNPVEAECEGTCEFTYDSDITPTVSDVSPTTISSEGTTITVTGTNLGTDTSEVEINIGDTPCSVMSATNKKIKCDAGAPVVGTQPLSVRRENVGQALMSTSYVQVDDVLTSVEPASGSLFGETVLTIAGLGFADDTVIQVGGNPCNVLFINSTQVLCESPPSDAGSDATVDVTVTANSVTYSTILSYDYAAADTPEITSVSPSSGASGDSVTISGSGFAASSSVSVDDVTCEVTSVTDTSITCTVGTHAAGTYDTVVHVAGKGLASGISDHQFTYQLDIASISPATGSYGGGQIVVISGSGFSDNVTEVTICDNICDVIGSPSTSEVTCATPSLTATGSTDSCDVTVTVGGVNTTSAGAYTYDSTLTASISSVDPIRGGTGGGTSITVTGSGFGSDETAVNVTIAGSECAIDSFSNTEIVCITGAHKPSVKAKVRVEVSTNGIAIQDNADFQYVDVWSSNFTWGGSPPPVAQDLVVIPKDMTVLLDVDTPVLAMLIIQGQLIFDEVDVELQAEKILVTDGGLLQVGTEEEPFQHKAYITLHGFPLAKELPIYGTKVLAVRDGDLELHGKPVGYTWSVLASTSQAGSSSITLQDAVDWNVGDEIVIATTGDRHSQIENEVKVISAISSDKRTLTLSEALEYKHLGETITYSDFTLDARAEVGLLTRNVVVRGSNNAQWHDAIEKCEAGFDSGEFVTQTCFQGRAGDDTGSDQFGGTIMLHGPEEGLVSGHIENIEMNYVGQAFRLGRYAIHFHLNGDMTGSYVREISIHTSFNRAINVHATHNLKIERNVIYNIMGGAFFTEDGVETGNSFHYNLAVYVKSSTSLQNDDITPAAYWVTNANNSYSGNHAAGGTHFGFWYRMHDHPDGPSFDPTICPKNIPMGEFFNNTVHSQGWFGVWIFEEFIPTVGGVCGSDDVEPAVFDGLTAWNCEKGAETVGGGAIQFKNVKLVNNDKAGYEFKLTDVPKTAEYNDKGPMIAHGLIAGDGGGVMEDYSTNSGVTLPFKQGFLVNDITFVNFNSGSAAFTVASIDGTTAENAGGFTYHTANLSFVDVEKKTYFRWEHECVFVDLDGTLTGIVGGKVVANDPALPPSCSVPGSGVFSGNPKYPGSVCPEDVKFHRYSFNHPYPLSLEFKNVSFTNQYGTSISWYNFKRVTHKNGWMVLLVDGETYYKEFVDAGHIMNISYTGVFDDFEDSDFLIIRHNFTQRADRFNIFDGISINESSSALSSTSHNGDWFFDDANTIFEFALSSRTDSNPSGVVENNLDFDVHLHVYRCFYDDCIPPLGEDETPPADERPDDAVFWSETEAWSFSEAGYGSYYGGGTYGPPLDNTDVVIPEGVWMVADTTLPRINKLFIYGVLEFEHNPINGAYMDLTLSAEMIFISGGRLIVGWESQPFQANAVIELRGDLSSPNWIVPSGPSLGTKAIGVFGGLDLHGLSHAVTWSQLSVTAPPGVDSIQLLDEVDWLPGDQIVITTTSFQFDETEVAEIQRVAGKKVFLTSGLKFNHNGGEVEIAPGRMHMMGAEVGLLTRNVRVVGQSYRQLQSEAFGARVLVGTHLGEKDGVSTAFTGFARISDVEFYHAGQEGFIDPYDPRFALSFLDTGDIVAARPSYLTNCAFNDGFSPALGVFGTNGLDIRNNVIYSTIGSAVIIRGSDHVVDHNLVAHMMNPGTYNGRLETRYEVPAAVEIQDSPGIVFTNNHVAGSQRAGIRTDGEPCPVDSSQKLVFSDNVIHSTLTGLFLNVGDGHTPCTALTNFTVYRNWDSGVYFQTPASVKIHGLVAVDNNLGLFPFVYGPSATSHLYEDKFVDVSDSVFVGNTDFFDCDDAILSSDPTLRSLGTIRAWRTLSDGKVGVSMPTFSSSSNGMPEMPMFGITSYQAIRGVMRMTGTTFTNFGRSCGDREDVAITPNPINADAMHPVEISDTTFLNTDDNNKIHYFRPDVRTINPADCIDMDCDGLKKVLLKDTDGSFLETRRPGTIIPESEFEWGGDPRRGLGDYRIPTSMMTYANGSRIDADDKCPNKGIFRDNTCTYRTSYQGYVCHGPDYNMMMLESMDSDTETRRVSPVGVLTEGYVDLINGPQDHGWCMGYTCQQRLSTFPIVLASGKQYEVDFSGVTPQNLRYHWLNTDDTQAVLVGVWYAQPWRLDVFKDGYYMLPENGRYDGNNQLILDNAPANDPDFYMPDVTSAAAGANYFDGASQTLWVVLRGAAVVDVKTTPSVVISFDVPASSVDDFFGPNLVSNLAAFLGIPADKIRFAEAVAESRRKRSATQTVTITIMNPPQNDSSVDPNDLSTQEINDISSTIVTTYQLGGLSGALGISILGISVIEPPPSTDSSAWEVMVELEVSSEVTLQMPDHMEVMDDLSCLGEGSLFSAVPAVRMVDPYGLHVEQLGSVIDPWTVSASLVMLNDGSSDSRATLVGTYEIPFITGWANFSELRVSHSGDYMLEFGVVYPTGASHFTEQSLTFTVPERELSGQVIAYPSHSYPGQTIALEVEIVDALTGEKVDDVDWKGHSYSCDASLHRPEISLGTLSGSLTDAVIDASSGIASYDDLVFSHLGKYYIAFRCVSSPDDYDFTFISDVIDIRQQGYVTPVTDVTSRVTLRFEGDYDVVADGEEEYLGSAIYNFFTDKYPEVIHHNHTVYRGSIMVDFNIDGSNEDVSDVLNAIWEDLKGPLVISYNSHSLTAYPMMWVEGEDFYGLDGPQAAPSGGLDTWLIAMIAIMSTLLIVIVIAGIAFYKYKFRGVGEDKRKITTVRPRMSIYDTRFFIPESLKSKQNSILFPSCPESDTDSVGSSGLSSRPSSSRTPVSPSVIIPLSAPKATGMPPLAAANSNTSRHGSNSVLPLPSNSGGLAIE